MAGRAGKLDKTEIIKQIIYIQQQVSHDLAPFALEFWQKLDVPMAQLKSLYIIASKGAINFSSLAQDLGVTPGNVTGIIDRLMEQGLVTRKQDPADRRVIQIEATEKGQELLANLVETHSYETLKLLEYMSLEELGSLHLGLMGLARAVKQFCKNPGRPQVKITDTEYN
jgi:DNA-binding MarR family transcriptional regulator